MNNNPGDNVTLNLLTNDKLSDGSSATTALISLDLDPSTVGNQLSRTIVGEGTYTYNSSTGDVTFVPLLSFLSNPTPISYELIETLTGLKDAATITITYFDFPDADNDQDLNNLPGITGTVNILTNDTLSTGLQATFATANIDLDTSIIGIQLNKTIVGQGTYAYNSGTGVVEFTPLLSFFGNPTPITYNLIEIATGLTNSATITITYLLPIEAINDLSTGNLPGVNAVLNIITNDTLSDGTPAIAIEVTVDLDLSTPAINNTLNVPGEGIWTYDSNLGVITFDPNIGFTKDPTPITYELTEIATGMSDSALITVTYIIGPPIANADFDLDNVPNSIVTMNILANDKLSDNSNATSILSTIDFEPSLPGNQYSLLVVGEGNYTYNPLNGEISFNPIPGFFSNPTPVDYILVELLTGLKDTSTINITYLFSPKLELIKTADLIGTGVVGDVITYSFTVINTGNVPVSGITISDPMLSLNPIVVTPTGLSPFASGVASVNYIIKPSDITAGEISNSAVVSGLSPQGISISDISDNGDPSLPGKSKPTVIKFNTLPLVDLNLTTTIVGNCQRQIRDTVTFVIAITREDTSSLPVDISVKDSLGINWQFVSATPTEGNYNSASGLWSGISILKSDTAKLIIKALILTNAGGLMCNEAWIESSTINDVDSNPGDKAPAEDDFAKVCVSVPINLCTLRNETATINAEPGHITYQWLKNGVAIQGATSETYLATEAGSYTYLLDGIACSNGACCSIVIQNECECAAQICIPVKFTKIR